ncbi:esterase D, putative [Ixodes scapularis]|uniref:S-formylglutathione hydrolase n=1 Tax=Ixodes scapularis TaxID=6945 RepID=B7QIS7_IXOSC|nr:esterase D, putative [Ixodes scapularis]|eukprot:XP_002415084.1 esterase D, putative [Ixodes scapularis]
MEALTLVSSNKCFGGLQKVYSHFSSTLKCTMKFAIFLPPKSEAAPVPLLYWLSGLTCTEQNFIQKAGAQKYASELSLAIVCPDTSPRGCNIEGEEDSWDLGTGAGFYVDATQGKWKENYKMYSYVTKELPSLMENFPVDTKRQGIFGHSMGGHGALTCALKNPGMYKSVSAFAPICNPVDCPWGKKVFSNYLGDDQKAWEEHDATCLVQKYRGPPLMLLVDQGTEDGFLKDQQLLPERLLEASQKNGVGITLRMQEGYDHSYFFIATFIEDHLKHHAAAL